MINDKLQKKILKKDFTYHLFITVLFKPKNTHFYIKKEPLSLYKPTLHCCIVLKIASFGYKSQREGGGSQFNIIL